MKRFILVVLLLAGLAPGVWWRSPPPPTYYDEGIAITRLDAPNRIGQFDVLGLWQLSSRNEHFGGYSALALPEAGTLLAASDRGRILKLPTPGRKGTPTVRWLEQAGSLSKRDADIESMARDPTTGTLWFGYEASNTIERRDAALVNTRRVRPEAMRNWRGNSGPESMARLADGRFLVISEGGDGWGSGPYPALLFPGDPVEGTEPVEFRFVPPAGFRPVETMQLPDGDMLILLRKVEWTLPPGFVVAVVRADPAAIAAGKSWGGREIARFEGSIPRDNFEGLALDPLSSPDSPVLWLISDDNGGQFQRTLLYKLRLEGAGRAKARERPARP